MSCPVHTSRRHPRICRFCRADQSAGAPPISISELATIAVMTPSPAPKPPPVARPDGRRAKRTNIPCRLSERGADACYGYLGRERAHRKRDSMRGVIVGETRNGTCWRVLWSDRISVATFHKAFIDLIEERAEVAA